MNAHLHHPIAQELISSRDRAFMQRAIQLAKRVSEKNVSPNPRVGALIVEGHSIVSEGYHPFDGGPHAERVALETLQRRPHPGAEMFVTLEPCSTPGRTGSCCHRIIASQNIRRVVIGCLDPNPLHIGNAIQLLQSHGIETLWGIEEQACLALNPHFNQRMQQLANNSSRHTYV